MFSLKEKDELLTLSLQEKQVIRDRLTVCNNSLTKLDKEITIAQSEVKLSQTKINETQEQIHTLLNGKKKIYGNLNDVIVLALKDTQITTELLLEDIKEILSLLQQLCIDCTSNIGDNDLHIKSITLTLYFVSYHNRMIHISNNTTELTRAEGK